MNISHGYYTVLWFQNESCSYIVTALFNFKILLLQYIFFIKKRLVDQHLPHTLHGTLGRIQSSMVHAKKPPFSRPIQLNNWLTHSVEWAIHSNDPFVNDPLTWMTHSLEWPIYLNDPFAWMTHSLGSPFQQTHSVEWLSDPFSWMTHSLKWPIQLNDPFTWKSLSADPFTWMTHSLEWSIHMQRWNVCLPLLSKQYCLKLRSFRCNKNIILQCRHTETPGVRPVSFVWRKHESMSNITRHVWRRCLVCWDVFKILCIKFTWYLNMSTNIVCPVKGDDVIVK